MAHGLNIFWQSTCRKWYDLGTLHDNTHNIQHQCLWSLFRSTCVNQQSQL